MAVKQRPKSSIAKASTAVEKSFSGELQESSFGSLKFQETMYNMSPDGSAKYDGFMPKREPRHGGFAHGPSSSQAPSSAAFLPARRRPATELANFRSSQRTETEHGTIDITQGRKASGPVASGPVATRPATAHGFAVSGTAFATPDDIDMPRLSHSGEKIVLES